MEFRPFCSTEIQFTDLRGLKDYLLSLNYTNIVFLMSASSTERWGFTSLIKRLCFNCNLKGGRLIWISSIAANPTQMDICNALKIIGNIKIDVIISIGGGSCIDLAKGIKALYDHCKNENYTSDQIINLIKNRMYLCNNSADIIAIPTTAGTGSEVTQWATIWNNNEAEKLSIDNPLLKPRIAFIVPELTLSMPISLSISSGLDAMCQAIEAYWSKKTNPVVQEIAYRAVELSVQNLIKVKYHPNDIVIRENICKASILAGLAFSQTRTTACHSISYPLTILFGVPHGFAVALTLDLIASLNKGHFKNDVVLYNLFDEFGGIQSFLDAVCEGIIKLRLSTFGIKYNDIITIANNSFSNGRMDNNPVDLNPNDVINILSIIL